MRCAIAPDGFVVTEARNETTSKTLLSRLPGDVAQREGTSAQACSEAGIQLSLPLGHCALDALACGRNACFPLISVIRGKGEGFSRAPSQPRSRRVISTFRHRHSKTVVDPVVDPVTSR